MKLPSTVVLGITTHGHLCSRHSELKTTQVPEGMIVTKVSAIPIGFVNFISDDYATEISRFIINEFKNTALTDDQRVDNIVKKMNEGQKSTRGVLKSYPAVYEEDTDAKKFAQYSTQPIVPVTYTAGQDMLNRIFTISPEEGLASAYNYKISILNLPGAPDLYQYFNVGNVNVPTRSMVEKNRGKLYISGVLGYLKNQGVTRVFMFDFTCAVITEKVRHPVTGDKEQVRVDERTQRELTRDTKRQRLNGGTRRRKTKTKSRKAKKRNTQWTH